ncbi:MAG: hypothetical protein KIC52_00525 [Firmicutes bacterium]|nr:hypothetical protein [Bacillota bacterium]
MNNTKKTLLASGMTIAFSMVLLVGTTFALFTGSVSNNDNKITAGILKMGGYAYSSLENPVEGGTTVTIGNENYYFDSAGQNLREDNKASIDETNFDPTKTYAKLYEVKNEGTMNFKCKFDFFNSFDGGLGDKLWFDFVPLNDDNIVERNLEKKNLATIAAYLDDDTTGATIEKDKSQKYLFVCGLQDGQDVTYFNEYCSSYNFTFDIEIKAAQLNGEFQTIPQEETLIEDVSDATGIDTMMRYLENGNSVEANVKGSVQFDNVMTLKTGQTLKLNIEENAVFEIPNQVKDRAGFENSKNNKPYTEKAAITVQNGATLEMTGLGTLQCDDYYTIKVEEGGSLNINGIKIQASNGYKGGIYGIYSQGNISLESVTIEVSTDNDIKVSDENPSPQGGSTAYGVYAAGGTLSVKGSTIHVVGATNGNTGNGASGIYINGATDVTITGTTIIGTGEGTAQYGICCFSGSVSLLSNVNIDIKGTAVDTHVPIGKIECSRLRGTAYSLYNRSNTVIEVSNDTTLEGETGGEIHHLGHNNPEEESISTEENIPVEENNSEGVNTPAGESNSSEENNPGGESTPEGESNASEGNNPEVEAPPSEGNNLEEEKPPTEENNLKGEDKAVGENIPIE